MMPTEDTLKLVWFCAVIFATIAWGLGGLCFAWNYWSFRWTREDQKRMEEEEEG